jgi:hypothetical protein
MLQQDPAYTELCSSVTLQSKKQGFFLDFAHHVTNAVGSEWIGEKFAGLKTDEERLTTCHELGECVHGVLQNVQELYRKKNASVSSQKRQEAERYLGVGNPRQALLLCNHAIMRAPPTGKQQISRVMRGLHFTLQEGRGFDSPRDHWIFSIYLILPAVLGPGFYSAYNRNGYQESSLL